MEPRLHKYVYIERENSCVGLSIDAMTEIALPQLNYTRGFVTAF